MDFFLGCGIMEKLGAEKYDPCEKEKVRTWSWWP
jgi:hypothetical protein